VLVEKNIGNNMYRETMGGKRVGGLAPLVSGFWFLVACPVLFAGPAGQQPTHRRCRI